jgi:hypothetical protein
LNSLARNIDDDGQSTFRSLLLDKVVGQELGNRGSQVNTVDKDVDYREGFVEPLAKARRCSRLGLPSFGRSCSVPAALVQRLNYY